MKKKLLTFCFLIFLFSCEAIFVEDISDRNVFLLAPTNNSEVANGAILFNWNSVEDTDSYQIQIAIPDFQNASQILLDSITTNTSITKELEIGEYQWRVKAMNSDYETPYSTSSFSVN